MHNKAAWRSEMTAINIGRLRWTWFAGGAMVLAFLATIALVPRLQDRGFAARSTLDLLVIATFVAAGVWVRRQPATSPWRERYVWLSVAAALVSMTAWYFEALRSWGQNSDYALGVISIGALFLFPPRAWAAALLVNHVVYCIVLFSTVPSAADVITGLVDNTFAVATAWLVGFFLYRARAAEFFKARSLAAMNAELREVMAIAAHDLRSPLLALRDLLELARRDRSALRTERDTRVLDLASDSCRSMVQLVSRLLDAHVAEEAAGSLSLHPQDLRQACAASSERLRAMAAAKQQRLDLLLPPEPALARIDATAFGQVMDNLVGNAVKFSPYGTAVECRVYADGDRWCVEVRDEGPSIPADERGRLFQKFHRGAARPTGGESSTGLGLFIVRVLTEAMNGRVTHAPADPIGSVFRVELPAVR
jgi:signal transduction histidine kinase